MTEEEIQSNSEMKMIDDTSAEPEIDWGELEYDVPKNKKKEYGEKVGEYGISKAERGIYDLRNRLNDLTGKEWVLFTKSWFIHNPPARKRREILHPAKFPESMIQQFIEFFTKRGELVLDPMLGTGSTLVACDRAGRKGIGIELIKKWAQIARARTAQKIIEDDARNLEQLLRKEGIETVDFCITSPPYWNMLKKTRGHVESAAHRRRAQGLEEYYSEDANDLGNIDNYDKYIDALFHLFQQIYKVLRNERYLVIICQNVLTPEGEMIPLAWDLAKRLSKLYVLKQERIWLQDNKMLGSWGYPFRYVSNVHHHYCLIFEKVEGFSSKYL